MDGDYNSARLLPEMTRYGAAQLTNSKFYGTNGMEALRSILKHADQYGLKYIFVHDPYYEPLLAFAGWRKTEVYDRGSVALWVKDGIPPAHKTDYGSPPTEIQGLLWGLGLPDRKRISETIEFPSHVTEPALREAQ